jgi:hypothetical protein
MKISSNLIKTKDVAGYTKEGNPIVYVQTYGGLHACFAKGDGAALSAMATAPHKAILRWLCERKDPQLQWKENSEITKP